MIDTSPELSLDIHAAKLRNGDVVAFPTETVYGLGADAWNADAVAKIFQLKGRPPDNPLIVHVSSLEMAGTLAAEVSDDARLLMDRFWPGPLALILPKRPEVLDIVTAGLPTVAIRMPDHPIPLRLIEEAGPLAAPSANTSGRPSPTRAEHVRQDFGDEVPVIEGGSCQYGLESTVLDLSMRPYTILRPGHITQSELEQELRQPVRLVSNLLADMAGLSGEAPRSPGMKYTHYAPEALLRWMLPGELPWPDPPVPGTLYLLHRIRPGVANHPGTTGGSHSKTVAANHPGTTGGSHSKTGVAHDSSAGEQSLPGTGRIIHYRGNYHEMGRDLYDRFRMADLNGFSELAIEPFTGIDESVEALLNRIRKAIGG